MDKIKKIESLLPLAMAKDRLAARREIKRILRKRATSGEVQRSEQMWDRLEKRLKASVQKRSRRQEHLPELRFNEDLPIIAKRDEITLAISRYPVIVVSGETGSGKSTQLPKFCLAAGRGIDGFIGCTQPRRIAATTVARRIAEELGQEIGQGVGYKIRFRDRTPKDAYIKMMTDGILLAETQNDPHLSAYDTIIVDEAHERSLNIDFILGILQTLLAKRDDLKVIITSATIDTQKFSNAFNNAPVIEVSGRMYPVEVRYYEPAADQTPNGELTHVELAAQAVKRLLSHSHWGDMLVFMPTEQDIRDTCELIEVRRPQGVRVMPLYARLTSSEQSRVFARFSERKVIVATNVAETSITIPGIKYVIDSGLARISRYSPRTRTTSLPVMPVSKSSADQRKGRCGRMEDGVCVRLFSEEDYQARTQFTPPEIIRANLAEVILRMVSLKLGDVAAFPFIDRPDLRNIKDGFNLLFELGAIKNRLKAQSARRQTDFRGQKTEDRFQSKADIALQASADASIRNRVLLTEKGRLMAKIPLDPRLSRMLIEAKDEGCIGEMAIIAAALSIQDPRERPADKKQEADRMQANFNDPQSDFLTLLNIWHRYHDHWQNSKSINQMKRYCREHFLSFRRMREWRDIHSQITAILEEQGMANRDGGRRTPQKTMQNASNSEFEAIHKSILSGFLSNIAEKKEKNIFRAAKGREVMIFPGSGLFNKAGSWIVAAEIVETSRVFARTVANIDSSWLEKLGQDLCKRTYLHPRWDKIRGEVIASEQVSLFGLTIIPERIVSYGRINPDEASAIFLRSALIEGNLKRPFGFLQHNRRLIQSIKSWEDRIRRRDLLVSENVILDFYKERLNRVYDLRTLKKYLRDKRTDSFLRMKKEDLLLYHPEDAELEKYPEKISLGNHLFDSSYCFEPGKDHDGVTVKVPSELAPAVPAEAVDWLVPGLYKEKIATLIKGLPKSYRKKLVPINDSVEIISREMPQGDSALITALGEFIHRRFGVDIPAAAWSNEALPDYLKMRISITAPDGKELWAGRDAAILRQGADSSVKTDEFDAARRKWEKNGIVRWDFGDVPDSIGDSRGPKAKWIAYPALEKDPLTERSVNLRLFRQRDNALDSHQKGVAALYAIHFAKDLKFLKRQLTLPADKSLMADYFGGAKRVEKRVLERVTQLLFCKNIRSEAAFYAHAEAVSPRIISTGREVLDTAVAVLTAYDEARKKISKLLEANHGNVPVVAFLCELMEELARLVPETFIDMYDLKRLAHLERYIKAVAIRAERALLDFEKDRAKSKEIKNFCAGLNKFLKNLSPSVSDKKRQALEEYFWMLEEYKVSVFAQELKTVGPISAKRLDQKLKQIERMV